TSRTRRSEGPTTRSLAPGSQLLRGRPRRRAVRDVALRRGVPARPSVTYAAEVYEPSATRAACTSISTFTLLLTSTPPPSSTAFHVMPNCSRSISVVAVNPAFVFPHGSAVTPSYSTSRTTGLETARIVRRPDTFRVVSPVTSTFVLRNVSSGERSTSRKSGERRCASRSALPASRL